MWKVSTFFFHNYYSCTQIKKAEIVENLTDSWKTLEPKGLVRDPTLQNIFYSRVSISHNKTNTPTINRTRLKSSKLFNILSALRIQLEQNIWGVLNSYLVRIPRLCSSNLAEYSNNCIRLSIREKEYLESFFSLCSTVTLFFFPVIHHSFYVFHYFEGKKSENIMSIKSEKEIDTLFFTFRADKTFFLLPS